MKNLFFFRFLDCKKNLVLKAWYENFANKIKCIDKFQITKEKEREREGEKKRKLNWILILFWKKFGSNIFYYWHFQKFWIHPWITQVKLISNIISWKNIKKFRVQYPLRYNGPLIGYLFFSNPLRITGNHWEREKCAARPRKRNKKGPSILSPSFLFPINFDRFRANSIASIINAIVAFDWNAHPNVFVQTLSRSCAIFVAQRSCTTIHWMN